MIWEPRVAPAPFLFDIPQGIQSRDPSFTHLFEELQRLAQIT